MKNFSHLISQFRSLVLFGLLFLFPFFFLNFTQEYFITNKFYLLSFGVLLLFLISTIELLISKKISRQITPFDRPVLLFLATITISTIFSSTNKIQALLNPNFGLVMMVSLAVLYFYLSRNNFSYLSSRIYYLGSIILSLITIIFYFQPFKNIGLPQFLTFLKNPLFNPIGSQLNLIIILGFFLVIELMQILQKQINTDKQSKSETMKQKIFNYSLLTINLLALSLTIYSLLKPIQPIQLIQPALPPFRLSWFAALEVLKNPLTALIGVGPDNFSTVFTQVKDLIYNQSPLWQINSFSVSHSAILQILTETGIFGLLSFGLLIFSVFKQLIATSSNQFQRILTISLFAYLFICLLVFPSSLVLWFLFFLTLSQIKIKTNSTNLTNSTDLTSLFPVCLSIAAVSLLLITGVGYLLGRSYASEYYFKKSLDGITKNSLKQVYDNQRQAVILNPYIEIFRGNFAQVNLLVANNLAKKDPKNITEQDRQIITQAIQAAITEGKVVISLNPKKAEGWQNIALIYQNVINTVKEADVWSISAYQRAILSDPQNPTYRVGLGGVYYSLKKYDDALRFFEQAVSLKPDWSNANYNYAWANFQKKNYSQAVNAMQNALSQINQKTNKADYEKVQKELNDFKKMLPEEEKVASPEAK
jgi:tetratricopeptide (TPR) repeat protein